MKWQQKIREKMILKEEFIRHYRAATMLFMMMGLCDAAVSYTVFKYSQLFFFGHEGGLLARMTISYYIDSNPTMFYITIFGHLFIYFGTIAIGIYMINAFKKETDDKIKNLPDKYKWIFIGLLFVIYAGGFVHCIGAMSWLVN